MSDLSQSKLNVLFLGASYGALPAAKMLLGGHDVRLVCRKPEADIINADGFRVRLPAKDGSQIELDSRKLPGRATAQTPAQKLSASYNLIFLAMQEPQYSDPSVRDFLRSIAETGVPCISIMNMPPPPYLSRIPTLRLDDVAAAYTDIEVWKYFAPNQITLCSPDPQAIRPPDERPNVLQVTLATNFKISKFGSPADTLLDRLQHDFESIGYTCGDRELAVPVKFKVFDSAFVPFAKWPMLLAGNYRCVTSGGNRTIAEAVTMDIEESQSVFEFVRSICLGIGARDEDLVPFTKYVSASRSLIRTSSCARALSAGAPFIERADKLVQLLGRSLGLVHPVVDQTVAIIDAQLALNRSHAFV